MGLRGTAQSRDDDGQSASWSLFSFLPQKASVAADARAQKGPAAAAKKVHFGGVGVHGAAPGSEDETNRHFEVHGDIDDGIIDEGAHSRRCNEGSVPRTSSSTSSTSAEKLNNFRTSMNRAVHTVTDNIQRHIPAMPNMPDLGLKRGIPRKFLANRYGRT